MSDIIIKYKLKHILNYTNVNQYSPTAQIAFIDSSIFGNPLFFKLSLVSIIKRVLLNNCYTLPRNKSCTVTDWSCWMMSSSSLRYLSLSSSTRRRCLWRGSSCFLRASVTRTFSSASVRFSSVRTESWFSSCMKKSHTLKNNITEIHIRSANIWKLAVGMLAFLVFGALLAGVMKAAISFITK